MYDLEAFDPRIIGGVPAEQNAVAHQVSIRLKDREREGTGHGFICGGSVISPNAVLTAAHCMFRAYDASIQHRPEELVLVMGTLLLNETTDLTVQRNVSAIIVHENYTTNYVNDIALLLFNDSLVFNDAVKPIRIAEQSVKDATMCAVSGWGSTEYNIFGALPSNTLLTADVPIVNIIDCVNSFSNYIHPGMICAGYYLEGGVDACQGDSGGPLVCDNVLTGIVSFGNGCAFPYFPGVYTDVQYYKDWIKQNASSPKNHYADIDRMFQGYSQNPYIGQQSEMYDNAYYPGYVPSNVNSYGLRFGSSASGGYGNDHGYGGQGHNYQPHHEPYPEVHSYSGSHGQPRHKSKGNSSAMSALTLLAFLFFLNILQSCLKEHMMAMNPTVMVMTAGASRKGNQRTANDQEDADIKDANPDLKIFATDEDDEIDSDFVHLKSNYHKYFNVSDFQNANNYYKKRPYKS
ncbi:Trypsin-1 [Pseudolycoriella hygida]|uniref:Trypsin-1 n=1 Tax=Pseudolycoriella hygida TaxID=35572 RepID=A0A9Q0MXZ8_9DIPT|nr:Trypsin-1 [Pseudolycoriella hygida]